MNSIMVALRSFLPAEAVRWLDLIRQPLFYNAGFILGLNVFPGLAGIAFWAIASHLYTPTELGMASAVLSAAALISSVASLGIPTGVIRFLSDAVQPGRFLNAAYSFVFLSALLVGAIYLMGISVWSPSLVVLREQFLYSAAFTGFVVVVALGTVVNDTFVAYRRAHFAMLYVLISNCARLALIFAGSHLGAAGIVGAVIVAFSLALGVGWLVFLPRVQRDYRVGFVWDTTILRTLVPYSLGNYVAGLLAEMPQTVLPIMVLEILGAHASGYAYIALMMGAAITSPGLALSSSAFAEGANAPERSRVVLTHAARVAVFVTSAVALVILVGAPLILQLFGAAYSRESTGLLRWMAIASVPMVVNELYFTWLRLRKSASRLILISGSIAVLSLVGAYFLMPQIGIAATGVGALLANCLILPFVAIDYLRYLKANVVAVQL